VDGDLLEVVDEHSHVAASGVTQAVGHLADGAQRRHRGAGLDQDQPVGIAIHARERHGGPGIVAEDGLQRAATIAAAQCALGAFGDDRVVQVFKTDALLEIHFWRVDAFQAEQAVHQVRFGVLVGQIERELAAAHGDVARDL